MVLEGNYLEFGHSTKSLCFLLLSCPLLIFLFSELDCLIVSITMKKGETSATISGAGDEKAVMEEKGKRASHCTRIRMNINPGSPNSVIKKQ